MKHNTANTSNTYPAITADTIEQAARGAAFVAIRKAYHGTVKAVKDADGDFLQYDGTTSGGTDTMRRLYYGFSTTHAAQKANFQKAAAVYAEALENTKDVQKRMQALEVFETAAAVYADETGNDTDDCVNVAALSIWENIANNGGQEADENAFMDAVRAVHRHIYEQDSNTSTRVRRKYDEHGTLLAVDEYKYIKYPHIYIDAFRVDDEGNGGFAMVDVNDELSKLMRRKEDNDTISEILVALTGTQRKILHYIALGYTYETIAKKTGLKQPAIRKHMERIRKKAAQFKK